MTILSEEKERYWMENGETEFVLSFYLFEKQNRNKKQTIILHHRKHHSQNA